MTKHDLILKVALNICVGQTRLSFHDFRMGEFKYDEEVLDDVLEICWETISYIKKMNGFSKYTSSIRFWKALLKLVRHPDFDNQRWRNNMQKQIDQFTPRARSEDYVNMMQNVYNWRNNTRINLMEDKI